jgi:hypothetical protein
MRVRAILVIGLSALLASPVAAEAGFGFLPGPEGFEVAVAEQGGSPSKLAGSHPASFELKLGLRKAGQFADGDLREMHLQLPPGFLVNPTAVAVCSQARFHTPRSSPYEASLSGERCPDDTQIGTVAVRSSYGGGVRHFGVFNLEPPYGSPGAIGFAPFGTPIVLTYHVREADSGLTLSLEGLPQTLSLNGLDLSFWGTPWAVEHDTERGNCLNEVDPAAYHGELSTPAGPENKPPFKSGTCTIGTPQFIEEFAKSYPTLPTSPCGAPLQYSVGAVSWQGEEATATAQTTALEACKEHLTVPKLQLTSDRAGTGTGLVFNLDVNDGGGILNPHGIARPAIEKATVSLPDGLTINPSVGSGLGVCGEGDFARESLDSAPGAGCPNASKVGEVEVRGMLGLPEPLTGSLFVARPYENRFGSLLALYMVVSNPRRGLLVKSVGTIAPDPGTGRLVATFEDLPRLVYTHFSLSFREGNRPVMISPPTCGDYPTAVDLASWAEPSVFSHDAVSFFRIAHDRGGGPCPSGGAPFAPKLTSGSLNPVGGGYTAFLLHFTREDTDQEFVSYSAKFPPGLLGRIAGIPFCPEGAIAAAKGRTGTAEAKSPSCPAASEIGRTVAGYGVGSVLAYAPGKLYLAGPYHGAPLSIVAVDSALVGPFDLGTVVIRSAIKIDPRTAQVSIDSTGSDPIPHILKGIPLHLRDIRVYADRPDFLLNPTSCDPLAVDSSLTGAGTDFLGSADDVVAAASDRFQLLDCSALGFAPRLQIRLKGRTRRGGYPSLRAVVRPRPGNANIGKATVTLPSSIFLAQEHIGTICTRPQFQAGTCPKRSVYGSARAVTPLLDQPLEGPVYLRASSNPLPDLVASLHGEGISTEVVGRIDSSLGGIRGTFETLPDAPVTRFVMNLRGGKRGVLVNAENTCRSPQFASVRMVGHNNLTAAFRSRLAIACSDDRRSHR